MNITVVCKFSILTFAHIEIVYDKQVWSSTLTVPPGAGAGDQRQSGDPGVEPGRQNIAEHEHLLS